MLSGLYLVCMSSCLKDKNQSYSVYRSSTDAALMSGRSNNVEWVETIEEVVITEECLTPENTTPTGMTGFHIILHSAFNLTF